MCSGEQYDKFYLERVFESLNEKELQSLLSFLQQGKIKSAAKFDEGFKKMVQKKQEMRKKKEKEEKLKKKLQKDSLLSAQWSEEDLKLLYKASLKYPPGTYNRWEHIARKMKHKFSEE